MYIVFGILEPVMIHIPAGFMKTIANPSVNWLYQSEPCPGTNGRTIPMPRGKVIGGSSSINGLIFSRGQKMDFDVWAQYHLMGNRWVLVPHDVRILIFDALRVA